MPPKVTRKFPAVSRKRANLDIPLTSLMWPDGKAPKMTGSADWEGDLGLSDLIKVLALNGRYMPYVRQILTALTCDVAVIRWRQAVLADFLANPQLIDAAIGLLKRLASLQSGSPMLGKRQRNLLLETADHLAELDSFVRVVEELNEALSKAHLESDALRQVRANLGAVAADPDFQALQAELPELRAPLERITSLTIGINLDVELRPESAVLLSINDYKVGGGVSWLLRVMGLGQDEVDESGIAQLHPVPEELSQRPLSPLFQDLDRLLTQMAQPIARALNRYVRTGSGALAYLEYELAFFAAAALMTQKAQMKGVTFCVPEPIDAGERSTQISGLTNIALVLTQPEPVVASDVNFDDSGRIAILTGPNSGGKTTYLRSVGLAQVMFQAGLLLPANAAKLSPVDALFTHFPALETRQEGRLAEEAARLREVFEAATAESLVLLNETFSSTSSGEAIYLAQDVLCGLRAIGTRAVFATHLIELAERMNTIEEMVAGDSKLFSLVAGVIIGAAGEAAPTYQIVRGLPLGQSYAREIARRHGISLEQILANRKEIKERE
jgi:hypothetical protein